MVGIMLPSRVYSSLVHYIFRGIKWPSLTYYMYKTTKLGIITDILCAGIMTLNKPWHPSFIVCDYNDLHLIKWEESGWFNIA